VGEVKYARVETEHRYLLKRVPEQCLDERPTRISDRYLLGTRMRLRLAEAADGKKLYKLGQKVRTEPTSPRRVAHTTFYLDEHEFGVLVALPATVVEKLRRTVLIGGLPWSVDEFLGPLGGLVLAEVDLGDNLVLPDERPFDPIADVTDDERFTGGALSQISRADLPSLMQSVRH
jgi:CYTH domain-containing protein